MGTKEAFDEYMARRAREIHDALDEPDHPDHELATDRWLSGEYDPPPA